MVDQTTLDTETDSGVITGRQKTTFQPASNELWYVGKVTVKAKNQDNDGMCVGATVTTPSAPIVDQNASLGGVADETYTDFDFGSGLNDVAVFDVDQFVDDSLELRVECSGNTNSASNATDYVYSYQVRRVL